MFKKIVVFTGAGISAESGLGTFRDVGGLWKKYNIEDVATPEAFNKNPSLVLDFYNQRRKQLLKSKPNVAHLSLAKLQKKFNLVVITQNIDNLHEKSGVKNIIHLHGKLTESRSTLDNKIYPINNSELNLGDLCSKGGQLRPNVVWFGEDVPNMNNAIDEVKSASIFIIIGTSLNVYPAANLINYCLKSQRIILIDPNPTRINGVEIFAKKATEFVPKLVDDLLSSNN